MPMNVPRLGVAVLWLLVGAAKAFSPHRYVAWIGFALGVSHATATWLAWITITVEVGLGVAILLLSSRSIALLASCLLGCVTALVALLGLGGADCGCFGAFGAAESYRRILVAGVVVFLSVDALGRIDQFERRTEAGRSVS